MSAACVARQAAASDLEAVVALDREIGEHSRRGFFEKRWKAVERDPRAFVSIVAETNGHVAGFVLAHVIDGEFGAPDPAAVLDAIGVDPHARAEGIGSTLLESLVEDVRARGAREIRTQARRDERELVQFFARSGFRLAPRVVLERSATSPDW